MDFLESPIAILLLFLPVGAVVLSYLRHRRPHAASASAPFAELRRRPAGESLRLHIDELNEQIGRWLVGAASVPIVLGVILASQPGSAVGLALFFLSAACFCCAAQRSILPLVRRRIKCRLGYQGERYVAEELNRLMAHGFHTFHDVPFETGNMNHVLVGPTGVFVVETKTNLATESELPAEIVFDGNALYFPDGAESKALEHVRRNRDILSRWLSSATADQICAEAVLTIPGWNVARTGRSDIFVVNPKQIRKLILSSKQFHLSPAEIHRSCHQLEQKCSVQEK